MTQDQLLYWLQAHFRVEPLFDEFDDRSLLIYPGCGPRPAEKFQPQPQYQRVEELTPIQKCRRAAFKAGKRACKAGYSISFNPHTEGTQDYQLWNDGFKYERDFQRRHKQ